MLRGFKSGVVVGAILSCTKSALVYSVVVRWEQISLSFLPKSGVGALYLVDNQVLSVDNVGRHLLSEVTKVIAKMSVTKRFLPVCLLCAGFPSC
ncbi:hypothetical protein Cflav_PD2295 [Pedosphaera parvula Ellin514]|uniref:Uncharacterized protein n=1 Tax=Pedosphaera parvula (strain Ellin514) TaxID=320771 RepID=B9XLA0_PEDPL|nr:hypothetical protein Cflav_PD2295 [Pedosphaera parvula Ellin514]